MQRLELSGAHIHVTKAIGACNAVKALITPLFEVLTYLEYV